MSEERADAPAAASAGALLRQARQAQGMHIAVLAAAIKVSPRKLEALEADRFDELPDATFTRALAQTVCRTLKIDPAPVLALLPPPTGHRLAQVGEGINAPFRERPGQEASSDWSVLGSPAVWAPLAVLLLAGVIYLLPPGVISLPALGGASAPMAAPTGASAAPVAAQASAAAPAPVASTVIETVHSVPPAVGDAASAVAGPPVAAPVAGVLQLRASADSWVEVIDGRGQSLLSRVLVPGETVGLDGTMPMKLTIGNAGATEVSFRGRPVDLSGRVRDNVARLDLK